MMKLFVHMYFLSGLGLLGVKEKIWRENLNIFVFRV